MTTISAAKFKAQCLMLINKVYQTHESIIITKHGKPMAKMVPIDDEKDHPIKPLKGAATYIGDIISPIDEDWDAAK